MRFKIFQIRFSFPLHHFPHCRMVVMVLLMMVVCAMMPLLCSQYSGNKDWNLFRNKMYHTWPLINYFLKEYSSMIILQNIPWLTIHWNTNQKANEELKYAESHSEQRYRYAMKKEIIYRILDTGDLFINFIILYWASWCLFIHSVPFSFVRSAFDFSSFNTKPNIRWISQKLRPEFQGTNCRYLNIDIVDICSESYWVKLYSLSVIMRFVG